MPFAGIPLTALDFYEDLEADNTKTYWTAHKDVYEQSVRGPLEALSVEVEPEFGQAKIFRPYRDVRFSKDKTPYKTHQGVWFGETSVYVQISAAGLRIAGGYWETSSAQIDRLRRAAADDVAGSQLQRALDQVAGKGFTIGGSQLSRVPAGYPKDHPRAELLRYKTLTAAVDLGCPSWLATSRAKAQIVKRWRAMAPLITWLDTHVGRQ